MIVLSTSVSFATPCRPSPSSGCPWRPSALRWALAAGLAAAVTSAPAATVVWSNPGTGDWFAPGNWFGAVPTANDLVFVDNGGTATNAGGPAAQARGLRVAAGSPAPGAAARGTVQLGAAGLDVGDQLIVGRSNDASGPDSVLQADGRVTVAGGLRLSPGSGSFGSSLVQVGVAQGGTARGELDIGFFDTSLGPVDRLAVGDAVRGAADGMLRSRGGQLQVLGSTVVGRADSDAGAQAFGAVLLDHRLQAGAGGAQLGVGTLTGAGPGGSGTGRAEGVLSALALDSFQSIAVGRTAVHRSVDAQATGALTIVSGGLVNAAGGGSLSIGEASGTAVGGAVFGAAQATGSATVRGNISGYSVIDVGRTFASGVAEGSLALNSGALQGRNLNLGLTLGSASVVVSGGQARAKGTLQMTDASAAFTTALVGAVLNPDAGVPSRAEGRLHLTRSQFSTETFGLAQGAGAFGQVDLVDNSRLRATQLVIGAGAGSDGRLNLTDSRLELAQGTAPDGALAGGDLTVGSGGGRALVQGRDATVAVARNLSIGGFTTAAGDGSVRLADSSLTVGGSVGVGDAGPDSRAELSLDHSRAAVEGHVRLGGSADGGTLFGQALMALDASLLTVGGAFTSDVGATLLFGLDGLGRGLGGYGALDAQQVLLRGLLSVDFSDLDLSLITGSSQDFDLVTATGSLGIVDHLRGVSFLGTPIGFDIRYGLAGANNEIWRLTLTRQGAGGQVPEPSSLALALLAACGAGWARRRRTAARA